LILLILYIFIIFHFHIFNFLFGFIVMNLFKYIFLYSFIGFSAFAAFDEGNGVGEGTSKPIVRVPSAGDDSAIGSDGSDEEARTNSRHTTPSPELFASPPQSPILPAQEMEENGLLRAIDSFLQTDELSEDDKKIASEIKFFVQQKRALLSLCGAYGKRYPHVAYLFNDLSDHVRKNEDSYREMKRAIFEDLSIKGITKPTLKKMETDTYEYEQTCRDAVGRIALLSRRWGQESFIYNLLGNREKLISNNRLLVLFPLS
jgi:hypothetical protein